MVVTTEILTNNVLLLQERPARSAVIRVRPADGSYQGLWIHSRAYCVWRFIGQDMHTMELKVIMFHRETLCLLYRYELPFS